jgi:hypothetical protein
MIPCISRHSVIGDDFWVSSDPVFDDNFWVSNDLVCVDDSMSQSWISFRCRFHASAITKFLLTISRSALMQFLLMISGSPVNWFSLMIRCDSHNLVFTIRKMINTNRNTEGIFPSVIYRRQYSLSINRGDYSGKQNNLNKAKKMMTWWFYQRNFPSVKSIGKSVGKLWTLFIMSIIKGITNRKFCRYFTESSGTVHFPIALLIAVLYR